MSFRVTQRIHFITARPHQRVNTLRHQPVRRSKFSPDAGRIGNRAWDDNFIVVHAAQYAALLRLREMYKLPAGNSAY